MRVHDETRVSEFLSMLKELSSTKVEVGVLSSPGGDILLIANVQEFGCSITVTDKMRGYLGSQGIHLRKDTTSINIPERSFVRKTFDEKKGEIEKSCEKILEQVINLQVAPRAFFETLGELCVGFIQDYMTSLSSPTNSPATIKMKGSSNPLIDSGRLKESINFRLV